MKKDSIWAIFVGILISCTILLVVAASFFRRDIAETMIPMGGFMVFLWLNAYRLGRKKEPDFG